MIVGSWALVGPDFKKEEALRLPGVEAGKDGGVPIFNGTVDEFLAHWKRPVEVFPNGAYIKL